jgi:SAM-dependent methyltransferase
MFDVATDAYDRFMGRYSSKLAAQLADLAGVRAGQRVLDVGCGPGALTSELVRRVGAEHVAAIDPMAAFVAAVARRYPGVDAREASAAALPFEDASFDATLSQLVVHFMPDPIAGIREMARVSQPGAPVVACVWDILGGRSPLNPFWAAAQALDPAADGEAMRPGARKGHLVELFATAGLRDVEESELVADLEHPSFEDWWLPFEDNVGPAGVYLAGLDPAARARLRDSARDTFAKGPFTVVARAWAARGIA